jgi:hypothetical protein
MVAIRLTCVACDMQASTAAEEKVKQIQECNKQAVKENCRCVLDKLGNLAAAMPGIKSSWEGSIT